MGTTIRARNLLRSTACRTALLRLTPRTCPVVRKRYVTTTLLRTILKPYNITYYQWPPLSQPLQHQQSWPVTQLSGGSLWYTRYLTIRVVVMRLDTPKPCGTMSSHRCQRDEPSLHEAISMLAIMVRKEEMRVSVYSFPVRRMSLQLIQPLECEIRQWSCTHQPANTLPDDIATLAEETKSATPF